MNAIQRAVVAPAHEIAVHRAFRWQVLRHRLPLAAATKDVKQTVENFTNVDLALIAAALGWGHQRFNKCPLFVGQIAGITLLAAIIPRSTFFGPHSPLRESVQRLWNHN
jgi:hypothetical protein